MRGLPWFRVYVQLFSNPKVGMAVTKHGEQLGWRLVGLWALASASSGYLPTDMNHIAFWLRISVDDAKQTIEHLKTEKLLDETRHGLKIHDWETWQFSSDNSTERVRRHRSSKKQKELSKETLHETFQVTPIETKMERSSNGPNRTDKNITEQEHTLSCARENSNFELQDFLAEYPKKTKQDAAARAYVSVIDSREDHAELMAGLHRWKDSDQWRRSLDEDGGRFVPDPDKFIFDRLWKDNPQPYKTKAEDSFSRIAREITEAA